MKGDRCFQDHLFSYVSFPATKFLFRLRQFQTNNIFQFFASRSFFFSFRFSKNVVSVVRNFNNSSKSHSDDLELQFLRVQQKKSMRLYLCFRIHFCARKKKICSPLNWMDMRRRRHTKLFIDTFGLIDGCKTRKTLRKMIWLTQWSAVMITYAMIFLCKRKKRLCGITSLNIAHILPRDLPLSLNVA